MELTIPMTQKSTEVCGGQQSSPPSVTHKATERNYCCHAATQKRMYEVSILLNDLLEAAAHFNESIQKHKLD